MGGGRKKATGERTDRGFHQADMQRYAQRCKGSMTLIGDSINFAVYIVTPGSYGILRAKGAATVTIKRRLLWSNILMIIVPVVAAAVIGILCVAFLWVSLVKSEKTFLFSDARCGHGIRSGNAI